MFCPRLSGREVRTVGPTVLVRNMTSGSPAEAAGAEVGDILRTVNGKAPRDVPHAVELVAATPLGGTFELAVLRGPDALTLEVPAR